MSHTLMGPSLDPSTRFNNRGINSLAQPPFADPPPEGISRDNITGEVQNVEGGVLSTEILTRCCFCSAIDLKLFHTSSPPSASEVPASVGASVGVSVGASVSDCQLAELILTSGYKTDIKMTPQEEL